MSEDRRSGTGRRRWLLPIIVLLAGIGVTAVLVITEQPPQKQPGEARGVRVDTIVVEKLQHRVSIRTHGSVRAAQQITVLPQVAGRVVEINPNVIAGGRIAEGDLLFAIDPQDYEVALQQREAALHEAIANLQLAQGEQEVAEQEWKLFGDDMPQRPQDRTLALRKPQLERAEAAVTAARARVSKARLDLSRTRIHAPFNAVVAEESVDLGQQVTPQAAVMRLVGTGPLHVETAVSMRRLRHIRVDPQSGSEARVQLDTGTASQQYPGRAVRLLPELAAGSRMARLLVEVVPKAADVPLLINSFVSVVIAATDTVNAVELDRKYVHEGELVHVLENGKLAIREAGIAWQRPRTLLIGSGLESGDRVVTTRLANPIEGLKLHTGDAADGADPHRSTPAKRTNDAG